MQVWNVLHVAGWKYRTQKLCKKSLSAHHLTTLSGYIFATKACIHNRKNLLNSNISSTCSHNMVNFGPLTAESGWRVLRHPGKFQWVSRLGFVTVPTSLNGGQPNFALCLAVSWSGTLFIHFWGCCPWRNSARCKIHFASKSCVLLNWQGYWTLQHSGTGRQPNYGVVQGMEWNYGTFAPRHFQQRAPLVFPGWPWCWA